MKRWQMALTFGLACVLPQAATAQTVGSYPWRAPTSSPVSPYLNLNRGGSGNAGINYFSLVRPQIETQKNIASINQELFQMAPGAFGSGALGTSTGMGASSGFTGQENAAPSFMNYGHYFPSMPAAGAAPMGRR